MQRHRRILRRRHVIAHRKRPLVALWSAALAVVALLMTGCGAPEAPAGGAAGATATPHRPGVLAARPCPGPWGNAMNSSNSVVIVTPSTPNHTASAQIGQTVEVQLPTSDRWAYEASASAPAGLSLAQPAGIEDGQLDLCIWNFSARSAGTATLSFSGAPICDPKVPCPAYAVAQNFIIRVG